MKSQLGRGWLSPTRATAIRVSHRTTASLAIIITLMGGTMPNAVAQTRNPDEILAPTTPQTKSQSARVDEGGHAVDSSMRSIPGVAILSDVAPGHWAYESVRTLQERYNLSLGDAEGKFRGNLPLTRLEFTSVLAQVFQQVEFFRDLEQEERNALQRLINFYRNALQDLKSRLDGGLAQVGEPAIESLTDRGDRLTAQQFSPTTKLQTQVVQALSDGTGANTTAISRIRFNLLSSFQGRDQLVTQLEVGNNGSDAISKAQAATGNAISTSGFLAAGGGLIEVDTPTQARIRKLYYEFPVGQQVRLAVGSNLPPSDFIDRNRFANSSGSNFASSFFANNPLIVQNTINRYGGAGIAAEWQLNPQLRLHGLYITVATQPRSQSQPPTCDTTAADRCRLTGPNTANGLFGAPYQATLEAAYQPNQNIVLRLQYTNAKVNGAKINALGLNAEWVLQQELALFGRFGFGRYAGANLQPFDDLDLHPYSWMIGATLRNFVIAGAKIGIAIGQPFVASNFGNATQSNAEAYFSFLVNDKINLIPSLQVVSNPDNQRGQTIWQWVLRVVMDF